MLTIAAFKEDDIVEASMVTLNITMRHKDIPYGTCMEFFTRFGKNAHSAFTKSNDVRDADALCNSVLWPGMQELMKHNVFVQTLTRARVHEWLTKTTSFDVSSPGKSHLRQL